MARLINDLFKISNAAYHFLPIHVSVMGSTYALVTILSASNSLGRKVVRWVGRDSTDYIHWNDLAGQINRLSTAHFDQMRGALAPAAIYDRRGLTMMNGAASFMNYLDILRAQGVFFLGGTTALILASLSLYECHQFGDISDPGLSDHCWSHLGLLGREPAMLTTFAIANVISSGSGLALLGGGVALICGAFVSDTMSNGFSSSWWPTAFRKIEVLLKERYKALGEELNKQWKEAQKSGDAAAQGEVVRKAELLRRRSQLIGLALKEYMNVSDKERADIIKPLIEASKTIIQESNNKN